MLHLSALRAVFVQVLPPPQALAPKKIEVAIDPLDAPKPANDAHSVIVPDTPADDDADPAPAALEWDFNALCLPLRDELVHFARKLCSGDRALADDVVQDSMVRALQAWPRWVPEGDVFHAARGFLYRIVQNTFIKAYHRRVIRRDAEAQRAHDLMLGTYGRASEDDGREVVDSPIGDEVAEALASLSDDRRTIVEMHYIQGRSCEEIAEILGIPKNTVFTRLSRARTVLERELRDYARDQYGYVEG